MHRRTGSTLSIVSSNFDSSLNKSISLGKGLVRREAFLSGEPLRPVFTVLPLTDKYHISQNTVMRGARGVFSGGANREVQTLTWGQALRVILAGALLVGISLMVVGCGSSGAAQEETPTPPESTSEREAPSEDAEGEVAEQRNLEEVEPVKVLRLPGVHNRLEEAAQDWFGVPYKWGGSSKEGVDCSGFVQNLYREAFSIRLPRVTETQVQTGSKVSREEVQPGDLVFFRPEDEYNHVGVYLGEGTFVHASSSQGVTKAPFDKNYWQQYYWTSRRPLKPSSIPDSLASALLAYQYPESTVPVSQLVEGEKQKAGQTGAKENEASSTTPEDIQIASCSDPEVKCADSSTLSEEGSSSDERSSRKGW